MPLQALIVEDDENLAMVLGSWIENLGYEVITTDSLEKAAKLIKDNPKLEIITLDLNLTDSRTENTLSSIEQMRASNPNALLVVVSGMLTTQDEERITKLGADGFMEKHDVPTEKSFFGKLRDVTMSLVRTPKNYTRNAALVEALAKRVAERCNVLDVALGGVAPASAEPAIEENKKTQKLQP
jgi:CheY-like chemotaxis protein